MDNVVLLMQFKPINNVNVFLGKVNSQNDMRFSTRIDKIGKYGEMAKLQLQ